MEQHRLITAERELLESTVRGSIGVMSEILGLVNPQAFSRSQRIRRYVQHMAEKLNLKSQWQYELAAMLSQIGCVTVPPSILDKVYLQQPLTPAEEEIFASQGRVGHNLLVKIPRLESVALMVAQQRQPWNNRQEANESVRIGAHLLKVASDFDEQMMRGGSVDAVVANMRGNRDYNPEFLEALQQVQVEEAKSEIRWVTLAQLKPRMIISAGVYSKTGLILLAKGQEVTDSAIARLNSFASLFGVLEPISVIVPDEQQPPKPVMRQNYMDSFAASALR
jgi:response regulator RpfG family c-di-GMP phosphodiesterase